MRLPTRLLTQITEALQRPVRSRPFPTRLWNEIQDQDWAYLYQTEDLLEAMDDRIYGLPLRELGDIAGYPMRHVYRRPRFKNSAAFSSQMVELTDVVGLCIFLEQLGFGIDPGPMVDHESEQIATREHLTLAQSDIYCYGAMRHKQKLALQSTEVIETPPASKQWRGTGGHRYECLVRGDQVTSLKVTGPRWRAPRHIEMECSVCGCRYTKGDPESALNHRTEHAKALRLLRPQPSKLMRERLGRGSAGERVDVNSPIWMHREMASRALRFKRDFGYDFPQWPEVTTRDRFDPRYVGYLFAIEDGAIDGACAFYCDQGDWRLDWAWIRPERRRHGLLAARWPRFLIEFGDFWIEHPISDNMRAFIDRHATSEQLRLIRARYPDNSPISNPI